VGAPGTLRMLELAHSQHGKLPWASLFAPAITLAEQGFGVSPRLHGLLAAETHLKKDPTAAAYFYDAKGAPWPVGHRLTNPALAAVLKRIAAEGSKALHEGDIARAIVDKVRQHPDNPGLLSLQDLATAPLCVNRCATMFGHGPASTASAACRHRAQAHWLWDRFWACCHSPSRPAVHPDWSKECRLRPGYTAMPKPRAWPLPTALSMWPTRTLWRPRAAAG
jgi:hypothetical protein